ncbi:MAG: hypothetical protein HDR00_04705 [Lachnospiraceae bacterium]|nr:hypothetical protein [Lachnospiraceae bacterium]
MKRKLIPIFLMLVAGAVASIIAYIRDYELTRMLWTLLAALIVFYLLGTVLKKVLDLFDDQIKKADEEKRNEGSVIEKEVEEEPDIEDAENSEDSEDDEE